jgi:hypothetical protein
VPWPMNMPPMNRRASRRPSFIWDTSGGKVTGKRLKRKLY